jgi:energy-coupling factor transport system permease protein
VKDTFAKFHPIVNFLYFTAVIGFAMFLMHPAAIGISFICAAVYSVYLSGKKAVKTAFLLPMMIFAAVINPLFNHQGVTILTYLPNGNPLTLEATLFGIAAAVMLVTVITWFSCFNAVITSDKFVYLFGRIVPALSLILSMALRFVPRFKAQIKIISNAQKGIGRDVSSGNFLQKARHGIKILSIVATWALENSIETADSMKARGYGLKGRTSFSVFRFTRRDFYALAYMAACAAVVVYGVISGAYHFRYFPSIRGSDNVFVLSAYFLLGAFPVIANLKEDFYWKRIKSKI